ncbi:hypothetical protein [Paenibacillus terrae]|nr:hypothetical protein [Paenibacillus terrae]
MVLYKRSGRFKSEFLLQSGWRWDGDHFAGFNRVFAHALHAV